MTIFKKDDMVYFGHTHGYMRENRIGKVIGFTQRDGIINIVVDSNGDFFDLDPKVVDLIQDEIK
jgi:hypothetical protein